MDKNTDRSPSTADSQDTIYELGVETELRIKTGSSPNVKIQLLRGFAEMYGTLLELNEEYSLVSNTSIVIYTWEGCLLKITGNPLNVSVDEEAPMIINVVLHAWLEERRQLAASQNKKGPVLLVVGGPSLSKRNLCKLLLNYAVRMEHWPVFLDLDLEMNSLAFPGTVSLLTVKRPADVVTGFYDHSSQIYQFGYGTPYRSATGYYLLMKKLSEVLESDILQQHSRAKTSGVIINGCSWMHYEIMKYGFNALSLIIKNFHIDLICVLREEKLYAQLERECGSMVKLFFFPKMHNNVGRSFAEEVYTLRAHMNKYLYGSINQPEYFTFEVKYSDIQVFKVVSKWIPKRVELLSNITESDIEFVRVQLSGELIDEFIAITNSDTIKENPMYTPVLGFFGITDLDVEKDTITVISPQPGPLPKKVLLMGEIKIKCQ